MPSITPFLWFDHQAEQAVSFYVSVFHHARIGQVTRYGDGMPLPKGTLMTASFVLAGHEFVALNGGPMFQFTPAISFVINCETQEEIDHYWNALSKEGETQRCGWLKDQFGVSWQVVPRQLGQWLGHSDPVIAQRVAGAMMQMNKFDIATLQKAAQS